MLAGDARIGLSREEIAEILGAPLDFTGAATDQVRVIAERIELLTERFPDAAGYRPDDIL